MSYMDEMIINLNQNQNHNTCVVFIIIYKLYTCMFVQFNIFFIIFMHIIQMNMQSDNEQIQSLR